MTPAAGANEFTRESFPSAFRDARPRIGLVLGSGLGGFAEGLETRAAAGFPEISGLPASRVPGHAGRMILARLAGQDLLVCQGRVHLYEGWSAREVAAGTRAMAALGIETLLLTNAAGIVREDLRPGQWMQIADHLNLAARSPLEGTACFTDLTEAYSPRLRQIFRDQAEALELDLAEGVYAWMPGPHYETPAEIRMLRAWGADAVGMSTVPEVIQARALGLETAAFSCLTNYGAGITGQALSHAEVLETGTRAAADLARLLEATLPGL